LHVIRLSRGDFILKKREQNMHNDFANRANPDDVGVGEPLSPKANAQAARQQAMQRDPMQHWLALTAEGNRRCQAQDMHGAIAHYERARAVAQQSFTRWPDVDASLSALVTSYLNLADAQGRSGLLASAYQGLCTLYRGLLRTLEHSGHPPDLHRAAASQLGNVLLAVKLFQARHGSPELWQPVLTPPANVWATSPAAPSLARMH
jgi:hypothetical protein